MRVAIHQPNFLPRLKVLQKIAAADVWVVLDSVQYSEREWQNRARIVAVHGNFPAYWLSIPVHRPQGQQTLIKDVTMVDAAATARLIKRALLHSFRRAPHWDSLEGILAAVDSVPRAGTLTSLCVELTFALLQIADRHPAVIYASSLPVSGKASSLMGAICSRLGADEYVADSGAQAYLCAADFPGIQILWQKWAEPKEQWPGVPSWRDISGTNYLCREGADSFKEHMLHIQFAPAHAKVATKEQ